MPDIIRVTAGSKRGRQLAQAKGARLATPDSQLPAEIREHNEAIEKARQEKLARREAKRSGKSPAPAEVSSAAPRGFDAVDVAIATNINLWRRR